MTKGSVLWTTDSDEFRQKTRNRRVFVYDPAATPSSSQLLPGSDKRTRCPNRVARVEEEVRTKPDARKPADAPSGKEAGAGAGDGAGDGAGAGAGDGAGGGAEKKRKAKEAKAREEAEREGAEKKAREAKAEAERQKKLAEDAEAERRRKAAHNSPKVLPTKGVTADWPKHVLEDAKTHGATADWPKHMLPRKTGEPGPAPMTPEEIARARELLEAKKRQDESPPSELPYVTVSDVPKPMKSACGECKGDIPAKEKTGFEKLAEELAYAGAIATQQMNEEQRADGKRYGIPGGRNPDGPDNPVAQAIAGVVFIALGTLTAPAAVEKKLLAMLRSKTPVVIKGTSKLAEEVAESLRGKFDYAVADALQKNGSIGPYRLMKKFTEKFQRRWEAHHILEDARLRRFFKGKDPDLAPSVILTQAKHAEIHAKLRVGAAKVRNKEELWEVYQDVYEEYPHWLKAIKEYFE